MGLVLLHELGHYWDDAEGQLDRESLSSMLATEERAYGLMYCALDDMCDHHLAEILQTVLERKNAVWSNEKKCWCVSVLQVALIDRMLGFPRCENLMDASLRSSFYTIICNGAFAKGADGRREFLRRWYFYERSNFKKP